MKSAQNIALLTLAYLIVFAQPAHAYLDPGTGSFILQVVLGVVLGGFYVFKGYLGKAKDVVTGLFSKKNGTKKK